MFHLKINDFRGFTLVLCDTSIHILVTRCCFYDVIWKSTKLYGCICHWCSVGLVKHWVRKYCHSPGVAVFVISTFLFSETCLTLFHKILLHVA